MNDKVDKQIKRYLKRISIKNSESKINGSCHYDILYDNNKIFHIRFANHSSLSGIRVDLDIVKCLDTYSIRFGSLQFPIYADNILTYIKALLLVGPECSKQLQESRLALKKLRGSLDYYKGKWTKYQNDVEGMEEIWNEKETALKELSKVRKELEKAKESINNKNKLIKSLKNEIKKGLEYTTLINKIKNIIA